MAIPKTAATSRSIDFDVLEKIVLIGLYMYLVAKLLGPALEGRQPLTALLLLSEGSVVAFVLLRRSATVLSRRYADWVFGFAGTTLPLLAYPGSGRPVVPLAACVLITLSGLCLQIAAKLILRRSFGLVAANRGVKISGPYRFIRHPMYAGYFLSEAGYVLAGPTIWNCTVFGLAWAAQIGRIMAEERLLEEDKFYREFMLRTRYRLIPGIF